MCKKSNIDTIDSSERLKIENSNRHLNAACNFIHIFAMNSILSLFLRIVLFFFFLQIHPSGKKSVDHFNDTFFLCRTLFFLLLFSLNRITFCYLFRKCFNPIINLPVTVTVSHIKRKVKIFE